MAFSFHEARPVTHVQHAIQNQCPFEQERVCNTQGCSKGGAEDLVITLELDGETEESPRAAVTVVVVVVAAAVIIAISATVSGFSA
mgnify:CR=1 FL=1